MAKVFLTKLFQNVLSHFYGLIGRRVKMRLHLFLSQIFSHDGMSQPERWCQFSHKSFLEEEKNAVCAVLTHKKFGNWQPRKVMREKAPLLLLSFANCCLT
jgi:hypothetical protein